MQLWSRAWMAEAAIMMTLWSSDSRPADTTERNCSVRRRESVEVSLTRSLTEHSQEHIAITGTTNSKLKLM